MFGYVFLISVDTPWKNKSHSVRSFEQNWRILKPSIENAMTVLAAEKLNDEIITARIQPIFRQPNYAIARTSSCMIVQNVSKHILKSVSDDSRAEVTESSMHGESWA